MAEAKAKGALAALLSIPEFTSDFQNDAYSVTVYDAAPSVEVYGGPDEEEPQEEEPVEPKEELEAEQEQPVEPMEEENSEHQVREATVVAAGPATPPKKRPRAPAPTGFLPTAKARPKTATSSAVPTQTTSKISSGTIPPWRREQGVSWPSPPVAARRLAPPPLPPPPPTTAPPAAEAAPVAASPAAFVRSFQRAVPGIRRPMSEEERLALQAEAAVAKAYGLTWQARGPPPPEEGDAPFWKGQAFRAGKEGGRQRWGNRGGKNQAKYAKLAAQGKLQPTKGNRLQPPSLSKLGLRRRQQRRPRRRQRRPLPLPLYYYYYYYY